MKVEKIKSLELFVTPEFRDSPWIRALCDETPKVWVTRDTVAPGHFGTFFGAMTLRTADYLEGPTPQPYIHDLYHLHELRHVQTLVYDASWNWGTWHKNVMRSEFAAGIVSECEAYLRIRGLRAKTFPHGIWADNFVSWKTAPPMSESVIQDWLTKMREAREDVVERPDQDDFVELQVAHYQRRAMDWCRIWAEPVGYGEYKDIPAFKVVNRHMARLRAYRANDDFDREHIDWNDRMHPPSDLARHLNEGYDVPFYFQAQAFKTIYDASNERYGNYLLMR